MDYIAHRGASAYSPENTIEAFALASSMGASSYELDVHLTSDGQIIVHHDYDLKRTAGQDVIIAGKTYAELLKYDVGAHFGDKSGKAYRIPLLSDVLSTVGKKAFVNVEIKNDNNPYPGIEAELIKLLADSSGHTKRHIAVSSFDHPSLERYRALDPKVRIGVLVKDMEIEEAFLTAEKLRAESLNISMRKVTPEIVARAHEAGRKVLVYTVNDREEASRMQAMGVDAVFTNNFDISQPQWDKTGGTSI